MFIIRDTKTGRVSPVLENLRAFDWLNGDRGFNGDPGFTHGDEKIYKIDIVTTGTGSQASDSAPVHDQASDSFTITRTLTDPALTDERKAEFKAQVNQEAEIARLPVRHPPATARR